MNQQLIAFLAYLSPTLFVITALTSWYQAGLRPTAVKKLGMISSFFGILSSLILAYAVYQQDLIEISTFSIYGLGLSLRLDTVSMLMFSMIAILSFVIMRYSLNYLDGDHRQGTFLGRLAATIVSVQFLVLSGNLAVLLASWILTSLCLHRLLVFYKKRPGAIIAAKKKSIVARLADISLLIGFVLLYQIFGTGNLEIIFQNVREGISPLLATATIFIALAALLKSAQFPTHGWLLEVMETPTPVSSLLHAGLLNAGPFLIIRLSFIMEATNTASTLLIIVGAFTAIYGSVVYLTQTSIKTALGYSSIAHMGFSLMVCGLGVYPAAMLHLIAHSFYKAHSFLSSGSIIDLIRAAKVIGAKRIGNPFKIILGILLAIAMYSGFAYLWGVDIQNEFQLFVIGGIIVLGLSRLFSFALDSNASIKLWFQALVLSGVVALAFFSLESIFHFFLMGNVPELTIPSLSEVILMSTVLTLFGLVVFIQIFSPILNQKSSFQALAVHIRNGLYINVVFDRIVRAHYHKEDSNSRIVLEESEIGKYILDSKENNNEEQEERLA